MQLVQLLQLVLLVIPMLLSACGGGGGGQDPIATGPGAPDPAASAPVTPVTPDPPSSHHIVTLDHGGLYSLRFDCDTHEALRFDYTLGPDTGNAARPTTFHLKDPALPTGCAEQTSTASYASVQTGWDRGHLVPANHLDQSDASIAQTFWMTNIVPQRATFNRGIWADTEDIAECYRDLASLRVVGGLVWDDTANDAFVTSHGIATPDWFWKVLLTTDAATGEARAIAWLIPNRDGLGVLDSYLLSISELEARVGAAAVDLPAVPASVKAQKPAVSWPLPAGCLIG
jgi:endonuclease G